MLLQLPKINISNITPTSSMLSCYLWKWSHQTVEGPSHDTNKEAADNIMDIRAQADRLIATRTTNMKRGHFKTTKKKKLQSSPTEGEEINATPVPLLPPKGTLTKLSRKQRQRYVRRIYNQNNKHDNNACKRHDCIVCNENYITNLSCVPLEQAEKSLLSRGWNNNLSINLHI